jgi:hypothetical protein
MTIYALSRINQPLDESPAFFYEWVAKLHFKYLEKENVYVSISEFTGPFYGWLVMQMLAIRQAVGVIKSVLTR